MRTRVDDDLCGGHGVCTQICPDVFQLDDDEGFARVVVAEVPAALEAAVREAAVRCPNRAIGLEEGEAGAP